MEKRDVIDLTEDDSEVAVTFDTIGNIGSLQSSLPFSDENCGDIDEEINDDCEYSDTALKLRSVLPEPSFLNEPKLPPNGQGQSKFRPNVPKRKKRPENKSAQISKSQKRKKEGYGESEKQGQEKKEQKTHREHKQYHEMSRTPDEVSQQKKSSDKQHPDRNRIHERDLNHSKRRMRERLFDKETQLDGHTMQATSLHRKNHEGLDRSRRRQNQNEAPTHHSGQASKASLFRDKSPPADRRKSAFPGEPPGMHSGYKRFLDQANRCPEYGNFASTNGNNQCDDTKSSFSRRDPQFGKDVDGSRERQSDENTYQDLQRFASELEMRSRTLESRERDVEAKNHDALAMQEKCFEDGLRNKKRIETLLQEKVKCRLEMQLEIDAVRSELTRTLQQNRRERNEIGRLQMELATSKRQFELTMETHARKIESLRGRNAFDIQKQKHEFIEEKKAYEEKISRCRQELSDKAAAITKQQALLDTQLVARKESERAWQEKRTRLEALHESREKRLDSVAEGIVRQTNELACLKKKVEADQEKHKNELQAWAITKAKQQEEVEAWVRDSGSTISKKQAALDARAAAMSKTQNELRVRSAALKRRVNEAKVASTKRKKETQSSSTESDSARCNTENNGPDFVLVDEKGKYNSTEPQAVKRGSTERKVRPIEQPTNQSGDVGGDDKIRRRVPADPFRFNYEMNYNYDLTGETALEMQDRLLNEAAAKMRTQVKARIDCSRGVKNSTLEEPIFDVDTRRPEHWQWKDPYAVLGLPPNSSTKLVKSQFRRLARIYHPDKSTVRNTSSKFHSVRSAYRNIIEG